MGRRVKKDIQTVKVGTDNPHLKRLQQMAIDRAKSAINDDLVKLSESDVERMRQSFEDRKKFDELFPRGRYISDIASGACVPIDDVIRMSWGMSDEELAQAARDARNIYQEKEIDLNFDSKLSREQIEILLPVMNEFVFAEALSVGDVLRLLDCSLENPVRVKSNAIAAYLMYLLQVGEWICQNWQMVADRKGVFVSRNGKTLRQRDFSKAMSIKAKSMNFPLDDKGTYILNQNIYDAVKMLKR